ncbi:MAG: hypothetical protein PVSMB2_33050 [Ktedonobacteraceae bacterium]
MNPISLSNLLNTMDTPQPETQWLIPNLLPIGLTLLYGQPRIGKSWLTLHLALSIALGTPALDQLPTTQADVLYLGLQETQQRMCIRTRKLLHTRPAPENFIWANQWLTSASTNDHIVAFDLWLTTHPRIRLLVIDSLQQLSPTPAGSAAQQDLALLHQLKVLADDHHIAILVTNQPATTPKRNTLNEYIHDPSCAIADAILVLKRDRGQAEATLHVTGTDLPDQELALLLPTHTMSWTLLGPVSDHRLSQERQDILALLQEYRNGPLRPKEIASILHKDVRAVTKLLFDMSHASQILLIGRGQYMTIKSNTTPSTKPSPTFTASVDKTPQSSTSNNGNVGNDSNDSNPGNDSNHTPQTPTDLPPHPPSALDSNNPSNQSFPPIDPQSFSSNHPPSEHQ